jgi:hypothetical protein
MRLAVIAAASAIMPTPKRNATNKLLSSAFFALSDRNEFVQLTQAGIIP